MRHLVPVATFVVMAAGFARLQAQTDHAAPVSVLDAAVQQHVATTVDDREAVLRVLRRTDIKAFANQAGVDLRRAETAVSTLTGEDLARVTARARQLEESLVHSSLSSSF